MLSLCLRRFSPGVLPCSKEVHIGLVCASCLGLWLVQGVFLTLVHWQLALFFFFFYCAAAAQTHNKTVAPPLFLVPGADGAQKDPLSLWRRWSFSEILNHHLWRDWKSVSGHLNPQPLQSSPGSVCLIYPNISWDLNAGMSATDETVQQKTEDTLSHPRAGLENADSSVDFPNGFEGRDGVNLSGDRQKLPFKILFFFFCPPQDPFNLPAPELLEPQISHGPEALLYILFLFEITVQDNGTTFSSNTSYHLICVWYCCMAGCFIYDAVTDNLKLFCVCVDKIIEKKPHEWMSLGAFSPNQQIHHLNKLLFPLTVSLRTLDPLYLPAGLSVCENCALGCRMMDLVWICPGSCTFSAIGSSTLQVSQNPTPLSCL